jgi:2-amino-4-hydroxy-6-hydroxymethyldihydropteridine diphosphokinase
MAEVYLLLGSNEGKPLQNLEKALLLLAARCGPIIKQSSVYQTEAWGIKDQPAFLNQAILIRTALTPLDLLSALKHIETETGRIETTKWGPRVIDIDILFYDNEVIDLPQLKIPHPYIQQRRFTLVPMQQIAPDFLHPVLHKTMAELLKDCEDTSEVKVKQ